jgi:hypothetical protein
MMPGLDNESFYISLPGSSSKIFVCKNCEHFASQTSQENHYHLRKLQGYRLRTAVYMLRALRLSFDVLVLMSLPFSPQSCTERVSWDLASPSNAMKPTKMRSIIRPRVLMDTIWFALQAIAHQNFIFRNKFSSFGFVSSFFMK